MADDLERTDERDCGPWLVESAVGAEIVIKKSRFLAFLAPVRDVAAAEAVLAEIHETHKGANHHCYAYRIGLPGETMQERLSDDGEPGGTAGRPMLEVMRRRDVCNVLAVVTRYFGGTLLGAGGLVHAYQDALLAALDAASLLQLVRMHVVSVACDYGAYGRLAHEIDALGYATVDKTFGADVRLVVLMPEGRADGFAHDVANLTNGQSEVTIPAAQWMGVRPDGSGTYVEF